MNSIPFVKDFYREHLKKYGTADIRGMGWHEEEEYSIRFAVATQNLNLTNATVLDVGCGFGGLYKHFLGEGIKTQYLGVDIMPEMVQAARKQFSHGTFKMMDILEVNPGTFDHVFCIGAMNISGPGFSEFFRKMIMRMLALTNKTLTISFLSDKRALVKGPYHFEDPEKLKEEFVSDQINIQLIEDKRLYGESMLRFTKK